MLVKIWLKTKIIFFFVNLKQKRRAHFSLQKVRLTVEDLRIWLLLFLADVPNFINAFSKQKQSFVQERIYYILTFKKERSKSFFQV